MAKKTRGWRLGVIAGFSIIAVVYIALQIFLFQLEELYLPVGILVLFMFSGIAIKMVLQGKPKEYYTMFQNRFLWISVVMIAVGFLILRVLVLVSTLSFSIPDLLLGALSAICETWGINAGIQLVIELLSGSRWLGVIGGAGFAMGLHWRVYGQTGNVLIFVFLSFLVLNIIYKISGDRLEVPMIIHLLFNVL